MCTYIYVLNFPICCAIWLKKCDFNTEVRYQEGSGSETIYSGSGSFKKFRIRPDPDPDPQHWSEVWIWILLWIRIMQK